MVSPSSHTTTDDQMEIICRHFIMNARAKINHKPRKLFEEAFNEVALEYIRGIITVSGIWPNKTLCKQICMCVCTCTHYRVVFIVSEELIVFTSTYAKMIEFLSNHLPFRFPLRLLNYISLECIQIYDSTTGTPSIWIVFRNFSGKNKKIFIFI